MRSTRIDPNAPEPKIPMQAIVRVMHGYVDDEGVQHMWKPGQLVEDNDIVELLIERGAVLDIIN